MSTPDDYSPKPYRYALGALAVLRLTFAFGLYECEHRAPEPPSPAPIGPTASEVSACAAACAVGCRTMRRRTLASCECGAPAATLHAATNDDAGAP